MGWFSNLFSSKPALPPPIDLDDLASKVAAKMKPPPAPPPPSFDKIPESVLDDLVLRTISKLKIPEAPKAPTIDQATIDRIANEAASRVKVPPAPALDIMSLPGDALELIAERAAELQKRRAIRPSEVPGEVVDSVAERAAKLVPSSGLSPRDIPPDVIDTIAARTAQMMGTRPQQAPALPDGFADEIAGRVIGQLSGKAVEDITWEIVPELAEAAIQKAIASGQLVAGGRRVRPRVSLAAPQSWGGVNAADVPAGGLPDLQLPWK